MENTTSEWKSGKNKYGGKFDPFQLRVEKGKAKYLKSLESGVEKCDHWGRKNILNKWKCVLCRVDNVTIYYKKIQLLGWKLPPQSKKKFMGGNFHP